MLHEQENPGRTLNQRASLPEKIVAFWHERYYFSIAGICSGIGIFVFGATSKSHEIMQTGIIISIASAGGLIVSTDQADKIRTSEKSQALNTLVGNFTTYFEDTNSLEMVLSRLTKCREMGLVFGYQIYELLDHPPQSLDNPEQTPNDQAWKVTIAPQLREDTAEKTAQVLLGLHIIADTRQLFPGVSAQEILDFLSRFHEEVQADLSAQTESKIMADIFTNGYRLVEDGEFQVLGDTESNIDIDTDTEPKHQNLNLAGRR